MVDEIGIFNSIPCCSIETSLHAEELVTVIGGSPSQLFLGTSHGRILHLQRTPNDSFKVLGSVDLRMDSAIAQLELVSALNVILIICNNVLLRLDTESFKIDGSWSSITGFCLNSHPVSEDPFTLQIVLSTISKQIHIAELHDSKLEVHHKVSTDKLVKKLAYSRNSVCFATPDHYYMYCTSSRITTPLFPINEADSKPLICSVNTEEFLLFGLDGLAIFVTSRGVSNKPPVLISPLSKKIVYKTPFIIYQTDLGLSITDSSGQYKPQDLKVEGVTSLNFVDGAVLAANGQSLIVLHQEEFVDQIEKMMSMGKFDGALSAYEAKIAACHDERLVLELSFLRTRIAYLYLESGNFIESLSLFRKVHIDPIEVISKFAVEPCVAEENLYSSEEHLHFLLDFLREFRNNDYSEEVEQIIDTTLLKLCMRLKSEEILHSLRGFTPELDKSVEFLRGLGKYNRAAELLAKRSSYREAFTIWKSLSQGTLQDNEFNQRSMLLAVRAVPKSSLLLEVISWLVTICGDEALQIILSRKEDLEVSDVKVILKGLPHYVTYLQSLPLDDETSVDLIEFYLSEAADSGTTDFPKLRQLILRCPREKMSAIFATYDSTQFPTERSLFNSEEDPNHALDVLLNDCHDYDAADILCGKYSSSHPKLGLKLLRTYMDLEKADGSFSSRIGSLLAVLGKNVDANFVLNQLPKDMALNEVHQFLGSAVSRKLERENIFRLSTALKAAPHTQAEETVARDRPVKLTESSFCDVCQRQLSYDEPLSQLSTGYIVHTACIHYPHICPVTNELLF